ncbi:sperm head and tail associated protein-like [Eulemur rufifrons]|uniref:sperm head and tail associated protein-like n=1 Tax=Eulemur rufifrons TaxID=859984 RepID=UPI0037443FC0
MPSPPPPPPPPLLQPPIRPVRCSFEPSSPQLPERAYCHGPNLPGSAPPSPYFDRSSRLGSPPPRQRSPHCSWISPPRIPRPCPRGPYVDQHTYICCCNGYPSVLGTSLVTSPTLTHQPPGTSPVTSPQLTHIPLESGPVVSPPLIQKSQGTCLMISPPPTHRTLGTCLTMSPPLAHRPVETRPTVSPTLSHRVVETELMMSPVISHWSKGRSYNDPPVSTTCSPPTDSLYHGCLKPADSGKPKPQLDLPLEKNCCGLPSQAGVSGSPSLPQESTYHYSHLSSDSYIPAPGSPHCAIRLPPGSTGSPCSLQSQASEKPCFESLFSWEAGGNSYVLLTPGTTISGPRCSQDCPYSALSFPSPLGNQFISLRQSPPTRSYNEPPLPTPVSPQVKSPKSSELRESCTPHKCHSLVNTPQHTPSGQPKCPKASTSPPPPSRPSVLSGPSCVEPSIIIPSNCCPKEFPPGPPLPTVVPRTLKTILPTCLPLRLPCDPVFPNSYAQSSPRGPLIRSPCNTHVYSVVPSTPHHCPVSDSLNHSTGPTQCHNHAIVPPCGTCSTPRGPPQSYCQPVVPPCSTHIYSFIPLRTPFDPQNLPIGPRARTCPDTIPCGFHTYSVVCPDSCKEPPRVPYSCPLPSCKDSRCSPDPSCSLTIIRECRSSDSQSKIISRSQSPHLNRSQSQSSSPHRNTSQGEILQIDRSRGKSKSPHHGKNRKRSKSPRNGRRQGQNNSPHHSRSQSKSPHRHHHDRSHRSKSPRHNKK